MDKEDEMEWNEMEYYSAIKKNEILPFATTWMELESIMPSKVSHRKTNTMISLMWNLKTTNQKQKWTHKYRKQTGS